MTKTSSAPSRDAAATQKADQAVERFISRDEVRALTGLSATTIWREICAGRFPAPVALSPNRRAFRAREVAQWMHSRSKAFGPGVR
jgi:predicted DNA-binding transcriptional regulator AlpA